ncbi:MAG TPA: hypothetical protein VF021_01565 [Longimicrobiales bacterium]
MKHSLLMAGALSLLGALPATAQERGVSRRAFTFLSNDVTVEITSDVPGTLQIVRGQDGMIDVAARVPGGLSSFAMGGTYSDKLRLTAMGGRSAEFIVVVPEQTYVRVRLPNRKGGDVGSTRQGGTFRWGENVVRTSAAPFPAAPTGPTVAYSAQRAPRTLSVPGLNSVRSISVRVGDPTFTIAGNHYMNVAGSRSDNVEVRTGAEVEDLVIGVPSETRDFVLRLGGRTALVVRGFDVTTSCDPVTEQTLQDGARWYTFSPEMGRLSCRQS